MKENELNRIQSKEIATILECKLGEEIKKLEKDNFTMEDIVNIYLNAVRFLCMASIVKFVRVLHSEGLDGQEIKETCKKCIEHMTNSMLLAFKETFTQEIDQQKIKPIKEAAEEVLNSEKTH